jgi:hypothetical protein
MFGMRVISTSEPQLDGRNDLLTSLNMELWEK